MPCGGSGAWLVGLEKIEACDEGERLRTLLERDTAAGACAPTAIPAAGPARPPRTWAAWMDAALVDADGTRRRLPGSAASCNWPRPAPPGGG